VFLGENIAPSRAGDGGILRGIALIRRFDLHFWWSSCAGGFAQGDDVLVIPVMVVAGSGNDLGASV
jgi:hypothetical protein